MSDLSRRLWLTALFFVAATGCTYMPLRRNTIQQAQSVADLQQQQVMNNLAMFMYDPNALPFFSLPGASLATVTDTTSGSGGLNWIARGFSGASLGAMASRAQLETYNMLPVTSPTSLSLMRCAYQQVVANCRSSSVPDEYKQLVSQNCPNCAKLWNRFYTGDPNTPPTPPGDAHDSGAITNRCLQGRCWLGVGCRKCVPKECPCNYVGHYCGLYVWVLPNGRDELAKLTLAILDYALHEPPAPKERQIVYYVGLNGQPTTHDNAVGQVTQSISVKADPSSAWQSHQQRVAKRQMAMLPPSQMVHPNGVAMSVEEIRSIREQVNAEERDDFTPKQPAQFPAMPLINPLQLQQQIQAITPISP